MTVLHAPFVGSPSSRRAIAASYLDTMADADYLADVPAGDLPPLKAPFPWFGGKKRASKIVWERFGNVPNYVEPFCGSMAVLLNRATRPNLETVNDKDGYLCNFWRAVAADPAGVARYANYPVSELDLHARHRWLVNTGKERVERLRTDPEFYDVQVAGWWVWGISLWIGSGWCYKPEWSGRASAAGSPRGVNGSEYIQHPDLSGNRGINAGRRGFHDRGYYDENHSRPDLHPIGVHQSNRPSRRTENPSDQRKRPELHGLGKMVHRQPAQFGKLSSVLDDRSTWLLSWFADLQARLRNVRVCCGDWSRVVTPSVTWNIGGGMLTGVFLDPPYLAATGRDAQLYSEDSGSIAGEVRAWAVENGGNPLLRMALCGYEGEHVMPADWTMVPWKAGRGYSKVDRGDRERIWFSPHCLQARQGSLFTA